MDSCLSLSSEEWLCAPAVTDATWHAPPPLSHLSSADTLLQQVSSFNTDSADLVSDLTLSDVFLDDLFSDSAILFSSSASPSPLSLFDGSPHTAPTQHLSPVALSPTAFVKQESPPPPSSPPLPVPLFNDSSLTHSVSHHSASASSHPLSQCATLDQCPTEQLSSPAPLSLSLSQSTAATLPSHHRQPDTELCHPQHHQQQHHPQQQQQQQRLSSSPPTSNIQSSTMKSNRCQSLFSADTSNSSNNRNNTSSSNSNNNSNNSSSSNCTNQTHQSLQLTKNKGSISSTSGHVSPSSTATSLLSSSHCSLSLSAGDVISDDTRPAHTPPTVRPAAGKDKCDAPRGLFGAHSSVTAKCRGVKIMVKPAALPRAATTGGTTTAATAAAGGGGTTVATVTVSTAATARVSSRNAAFQSPVSSGFKVEHNTTTASSAINSSSTPCSSTSSSSKSLSSSSLTFSSSSSKSSSSSSSKSSSSSSISSSKSSSSSSTSSSKSSSSPSTSSSESSSSSTPFSNISSGVNEEQLRLMVPGMVAGQQVRRRLVLRVSADHLRLIRAGVVEVVVRSSDLDQQPSEAEECAFPAEQKHYLPNQHHQHQQQQQQHQHQQQYEPDYSELACFSDGDEWLVPLESLPALGNMTAPLTTPASSYQHQQQQQLQLPPADEDGIHGQLLLPDDLQDLVLDTDDLARLPLHSANTILDDLMSSGDTDSSHSSVSNSLQLTPSPQSHTLSVIDDIGCLSDSGVDIGDSGCTSLPPLHPSPHEQQQQQSDFGKRRVSVCHKRRRAAAAAAAVAVHKRSTPYSRSHTPPPPPAAAAAPKPTAVAFSGSPSPSSAAAAAAKSALTEEQRRERKRQQNKLAATRYRQKKRQEMTVVAVDEDQLEQRNRQLKERVLSLTKELDYLRQLMRQVLLHKQVV